MTDRTAALLTLLQLTDSGFPTGGYAFSHGLEGLFALGIVRDAADVEAMTRVQIEESLAVVELPIVRFAWEAAHDGDRLAELDAWLDALKPVPAFRIASRRVGRRFLESAASLLGDGVAMAWLRDVATGAAIGHHAVAFGVVLRDAGIDRDTAIAAYAGIALNGYIAAAVRLAVIGPHAAQAIIATLRTDLLAAIATAMYPLTLDDLGGSAPLIDLAGLRQPSLSARLFSS